MSPATVTHTEVFTWSAQYQISHKSIKWEQCWYMWTDRQMN